MIINGKEIATRLYAQLKERRTKIARPLTLGVLIMGTDPVIEQFVQIKSHAAQKLDIGVTTVHMPVFMSLSGATRADQVADSIKELSSHSDAVIVQLPLPPHIDIDRVLCAIPPEKDVDALNPAVSEEAKLVHAPVALAVLEILKSAGIETAGKKVAVVGAGRLVGAPCALLLREYGASVAVLTEGESLQPLKDADIVISGAGKAGLIQPDDLKEGVVLIDAGTSESAGEIRGDIDPACAEIASVFTPVPGGVGPIAVAMIFKNFLDLVEKKGKSPAS